MAVATPSRTCVALRNANLPPSSPITLVVPVLPQSFYVATISAESASNCPVAKEVQPELTSYDLHLSDGSKPPQGVPFIAVVGDATRFTMNNIQVQADLNGDRSTQIFHACRENAEDGIHLTVWNGPGLTGTRLWHGFYYQPEKTTPVPDCAKSELSGSN